MTASVVGGTRCTRPTLRNHFHGTHIVQHWRTTLPERGPLADRESRRLAGAKTPFPQVPPGYPYGQYPNGAAARWELSAWRLRPRTVVPDQPTQQTATFGGPASPDGPGGIRIQAGEAGRPTLSSRRSRPAAPCPPTILLPSARRRLCECRMILGRVGNDVVLTGDLLHRHRRH